MHSSSLFFFGLRDGRLRTRRHGIKLRICTSIGEFIGVKSDNQGGHSLYLLLSVRLRRKFMSKNWSTFRDCFCLDFVMNVWDRKDKSWSSDLVPRSEKSSEIKSHDQGGHSINFLCGFEEKFHLKNYAQFDFVGIKVCFCLDFVMEVWELEAIR